MRRVQQGYSAITDFGQRRPISFDALFSSDSDSDSEVSVTESEPVTAPVLTAPVLTAPGLTAPVLTAPGLTAPGLTAPGLTAPGLTAPGLTAPGLTAPGLTAPVQQRNFNIPPPSTTHIIVSVSESPENNYGKNIPDDPISVWTEKVIASFEKVSEVKKELSTDFKESLGRLSFFRQPLVTK